MKSLDEGAVRFWGSLAVLLLSVGCASQQGKGDRAADERKGARTPEEIEALFSREQEPPAAREAKAADGAWAAQFPSTDEVVVTRGDGHSLAEFSLGTEAKTRCVFYDEAVDAGATIGIVLGNMAKTSTIEKVAPYRITSAQGIPVAFLEARYTVPGDGGKQAGSLKMAVSPRLETPVFCYLDEPGYAGAFEKAITHVLTTLSTAEPAAEAAYTEVWSHDIDGQVLGFQWLQLHDEDGGKRTTITISADFFPAAPGELSITDEVEVVTSDASGVVEGTYYQGAGEAVAYDLKLERSGKSKYKVTGKVQGGDFKSEFTATKLPDDIAAYRLIRQNHKKTTKVTSPEYSPATDPKAPTSVSYAIDSQARSVTVAMGDLSLRGIVDDDGLVSQLTNTIEGHDVKMEVISRTGKF